MSQPLARLLPSYPRHPTSFPLLSHQDPPWTQTIRTLHLQFQQNATAGVEWLHGLGRQSLRIWSFVQ